MSALAAPAVAVIFTRLRPGKLDAVAAIPGRDTPGGIAAFGAVAR